MPQKPPSFRERLKRIALWQWGLLTMIGGLLAGGLTAAMPSPRGPLTAEQRAAALGRSLVVLFFVVVGVVLIVLHFVRRKQRP
jgi:hypothetical protein